MLGASCRISAPKKISPRAPISPMAIPNILRPVTFSLIRIAERISTIIGVVVTSTALFIGVDNESPLKKTSILIPMPSTAQSNMRA